MGVEKNSDHVVDRVNPGGVASPGTSLKNHTGSWRSERPLYAQALTPCHGACPAHENIPGYLSHLANDDPKKAWEVLVEDNPLPAVSGRVCPHPCESSCHRGHYDQSVSIHSVERFLGDKALQEGWNFPGVPETLSDETVAIVGAGPAGLSCAYHLRRLGFRVSLFDSFPEAGGTCRIIPDYRLPEAVLSGEVERILELGISFFPGKMLGRDVSLDELLSDFSAVYLAPGRQLSRSFSVAHAVPGDLHHGLDLLWTWKNVGTLPRWNRVIIVGGGNTAIDLARTLLRTGTREVHVVTDEDIPGDTAHPVRWPMPAIGREIAMALEEGVHIHAGRSIKRLLLHDEQVVGVELVHALKEQEASAPVHRSFSGTETILEADQVIPAVGQVVSPQGLGTILGNGSAILVTERGQVEGHERIFAGGDAVAGGGLVSLAIGSGHRGARMIGAQIRKISIKEDPVLTNPIPFSSLNLQYFEPVPAYAPEELSISAREGFVEIESTGPEDHLRKEADRCFSCGHCLECDNCWTLCPDGAVLKTSDFSEIPAPYLFDYDYCKGCGLCARECPSGYIRMVPEG